MKLKPAYIITVLHTAPAPQKRAGFRSLNNFMKKIVALLILFCLNSTFIFAQDTAKSTYRITTPVLLDLGMYFSLTGEKVFTSKTIGATVGYRPSTQNSGANWYNTGPWSTYQMNNFQNKLYSSFTVDIFSKFYFGERHKSFLMPDAYYRLWWFDSKDCSFSGKGGRIKNNYDYSYDGIRTERQSLVGIKLLYGRSYKMNKHGSFRPIIEPNAGMGLFVKSYTFQTYNGTVNNIYYDYHKETGIGLYPSFHLGLNIGVEFDVKKKENKPISEMPRY